MADLFDVLDRLIVAGTKEMQRNGSMQMYGALDPNKAAAMERAAQSAQMRRMNRRYERMQENKAAEQERLRAQRAASNTDDGIGLGGAALAGGALLALGALAYNAFSSDDSSDTTVAQPSNSSNESVNKPVV